MLRSYEYSRLLFYFSNILNMKYTPMSAYFDKYLIMNTSQTEELIYWSKLWNVGNFFQAHLFVYKWTQFLKI